VLYVQYHNVAVNLLSLKAFITLGPFPKGQDPTATVFLMQASTDTHMFKKKDPQKC
jgi:hypothetical protein